MIVDDEEDELNALKLTIQFAKDIKSEIFIASDPESALNELEKHNFDLVLSDFNMPEMNGVEFLNKVKEKSPDTIRMLITACTNIGVAKDAINKAEIHSFIEKPWYNDELRSLIHDALNKKNNLKTYDTTRVENVGDAFQAIDTSLKKMFNDTLEPEFKRRIFLEFTSANEFNNFYHEIKNMKNINVNDVQILNNKFLIELWF